MQSFEAVYARMLFAAGVRTQTELANILDMKQASISEAKKRGSIPAEWCMRLPDHFIGWRRGLSGVSTMRVFEPSDLRRASSPRWNEKNSGDFEKASA